MLDLLRNTTDLVTDEFKNTGFQATGEAFSIATLMYARMRRVAGRMIDVMYLVENTEYARYVIDLAVTIQDDELDRLASRLQRLLQKESEKQSVLQPSSTSQLKSSEKSHLDEENSEISKEEYQAQISHHYIGALR